MSTIFPNTGNYGRCATCGEYGELDPDHQCAQCASLEPIDLEDDTPDDGAVCERCGLPSDDLAGLPLDAQRDYLTGESDDLLCLGCRTLYDGPDDPKEDD